MARKGRGKLVDRGIKYPKVFIYVPSQVLHDSNFPFRVGDHLNIEIDTQNKTLIIKSVPKK